MQHCGSEGTARTSLTLSSMTMCDQSCAALYVPKTSPQSRKAFHCPQAFVSLDFQCRDAASESKTVFERQLRLEKSTSTVLSYCTNTTADVTSIKCCIMAYLRAAAGGSKAQGLAQSCPSCREALAGLGSQSCGLLQPSALLATGSSLIPAGQNSRYASCSNKHSLTSWCNSLW